MLKQIWEIVSSKTGCDDWTGYLTEYVDRWKDLYKGRADYMDYTVRTMSGVKSCKRKTLSMPKKVAQDWAKLLFNEECTIELSDESAHEFLWSVLDSDDNQFSVEFAKELEQAFAYGGKLMLEYISNDTVKIDFFDPMSFIPLKHRNGKVTDVAVFTRSIMGDKYLTHIQYHLTDNGYTIRNEIYASSKENEVGELSLFALNELGLVEELRLGDIKPFFQTIEPNLANNVAEGCPYGLSIYANSTDTIQGVDEIYTDFINEYSLSKRRIVVANEALKKELDTETGRYVSYFDNTDSVFMGVSSDDPLFQAVDFAIRDASYINGLNQILNLLAMQVGMDSGAFSFDGKSMKTATEIISEKSVTFGNKRLHEIVLKQAIVDMVDAIINCGRLLGLSFNEYEVAVKFSDNIIVDDDKKREEERKDVVGGVMPKIVYLMRNYGLTEEDAREWVRLAQEENGTTLNMDMIDSVLGGGGVV